MWSPFYMYYYIQDKANSDRCLSLQTMVDALCEFEELKQVGQASFENVDSFPWLSLQLVHQVNGNYVVTDEILPSDYGINYISIICSKGDIQKTDRYEILFSNIAERMGAKLYLEEDDDGGEDVEIYKI